MIDLIERMLKPMDNQYFCPLCFAPRSHLPWCPIPEAQEVVSKARELRKEIDSYPDEYVELAKSYLRVFIDNGIIPESVHRTPEYICFVCKGVSMKVSSSGATLDAPLEDLWWVAKLKE